MFIVVEMSSAQVLGTFPTVSEANAFIEGIDSSSEYTRLLDTYGSLRRVQQEVIIELGT